MQSLTKNPSVGFFRPGQESWLWRWIWLKSGLSTVSRGSKL